MTKKIKTIITAIVALLIVIAVIIGLAISGQFSSKKLTFSFNGNIDLFVGDTVNINYTCNFDDAEIVFSVNDPAVAKVVGKKIIALKTGSTKLQATASYKSETVYSECTITVLSNPKPSYVVNLEIDGDDYLVGNNIYSSGKTFFNITLSLGDNILESYPTVSASDGITVRKDFSRYLLTATCDGYVTFHFPEYDVTVTYYIFIRQS